MEIDPGVAELLKTVFDVTVVGVLSRTPYYDQYLTTASPNYTKRGLNADYGIVKLYPKGSKYFPSAFTANSIAYRHQANTINGNIGLALENSMRYPYAMEYLLAPYYETLAQVMATPSNTNPKVIDVSLRDYVNLLHRIITIALTFEGEAGDTGGIAHLYLIPENILVSPGRRDVSLINWDFSQYSPSITGPSTYLAGSPDLLPRDSRGRLIYPPRNLPDRRQINHFQIAQLVKYYVDRHWVQYAPLFAELIEDLAIPGIEFKDPNHGLLKTLYDLDQRLNDSEIWSVKGTYVVSEVIPSYIEEYDTDFSNIKDETYDYQQPTVLQHVTSFFSKLTTL